MSHAGSFTSSVRACVVAKGDTDESLWTHLYRRHCCCTCNCIAPVGAPHGARLHLVKVLLPRCNACRDATAGKHTRAQQDVLVQGGMELHIYKLDMSNTTTVALPTRKERFARVTWSLQCAIVWLVHDCRPRAGEDSTLPQLLCALTQQGRWKHVV
jgi:hypothetical protein